MALLSLKKDSGMVNDLRIVIIQDGPKFFKNWDRNDYQNGAEMTWDEMTRVLNSLGLFRLLVMLLKLGIVKQAWLRK